MCHVLHMYYFHGNTEAQEDQVLHPEIPLLQIV